ncbi:cadherin-5 [Nothobranchius furzeri]|uniref:Cadherin-5 n=2 Tax=Nothobranchius TaxID=28779 RepID=A0A1A7ZMT0_NOTFU|nr:cadherin-5 [Nothobranchius furzeri]KAF7220284.1 cadherin-5-like [Nothobranchius furzeri]
MMMARFQLWMAGLITTLFLFVVIAQGSGLPAVVPERHDSADIVRKESHPVLLRQKREWIWNSLYVEEEKPAPIPYKIGKLKSSKAVEVKKFRIEGEGANTIFTVDEKGDLFVRKSLDREEKASYNLTARMLDGNNKLIEDAGEFVVQVTDINDNSPIFPRTYNGSILERSMKGTTVVKVSATDADDPTTPNGELRYSLTSPGDTSSFEIDPITGVISCKINTLDRESQRQYVLVVKAQDMRGMASGSTATTSVTIVIDDINDNLASFTKKMYSIEVPENHKLNEKIGTLELKDEDEIKNKKPTFTIQSGYKDAFSIQLNDDKDGNLLLKKPLDYETRSNYVFIVEVNDDVRFPADNSKTAVTRAEVTLIVVDVDEPPVFSQSTYIFSALEEQMLRNIGKIQARDPDQASRSIKYSILDKDCPIDIDPFTGQLSTLRKLDRELQPTHEFQVRAQEHPDGLESLVKVKINVQDVNDNTPELVVDEIFVCENDMRNMVIGTLRASDKDEQMSTFSFSFASHNSNFSIRDHGNNTADIIVRQGPFSLEDPNDYSVDVRISDGGQPIQTSVTKLSIKSCRCDARRIPTQCKASSRKMGVSVHALIAILLCILTILVIVILFVMRKRYQKDSLASMKNSGEIHEQLVTYDEEGGGEMDTNGYDVSILTSACNDGSLLRHPDCLTHPYAMVQKPHHHTQPTACKGDMAAMIEMKKDEADHDRDGFPYDTLHIYGYEGPESLAGSLSSLETSSSGSNLDYDFLNDWGPRFKALAELYGVDGPDYYHQY